MQFKKRDSAHEEVTNESINGVHFEPWNTKKGEGHLEEMHERCQELAISHRLESAIHHIIGSGNLQRFCALLISITATVPEHSHKDQERIAITDRTDAANRCVIHMQQQHQLAPCIVQQW